MTILYAAVTRGTVILAEFSAVTGNTGAVARRILDKIPTDSDSRGFHVFLLVAGISFAYLEDIHMRFMKNYGRIAHSAPAYAMNDEFCRVLHQQMEYFSSNPSADTLNHVQGEVGEIRSIMVDNIENNLQRGDHIELLVDKTATMQHSAFDFKRQSRRLSQALWMKKVNLLACLICLIVVLLYIIIATCCGGLSLPSCRS